MYEDELSSSRRIALELARNIHPLHTALRAGLHLIELRAPESFAKRFVLRSARFVLLHGFDIITVSF